MRETPRRRLWRARMVAAFLVGIASSLPAAAGAPTDPLEPLNRAIFEVNRELDHYVLRPTTVVYRFAVPNAVRRGIGQFLDNLLEPVYALDALLQGDAAGLEVAISRFLLNTFVGLGGLIDVAAEAGIHSDSHGFGQTLAHWGVEPGPYLVLPLLGPSTVRELAGMGIDAFSTPHYYLVRTTGMSATFQAAETGLRAVTFRDRNFEQVDAGFAGSLDAYASARSVYLQMLRARDGTDEDLMGESELDFDAFEE